MKMKEIMLPLFLGFIGGILAIVIGAFLFYRSIPESGFVKFTRSNTMPKLYKDIKILEYAKRPQGVYIRYKNTGDQSVEMVSFKIRGYKDGKLWGDIEEAIYEETEPGEEQEGILKLKDYAGEKSLQLEGLTFEIEMKYAYPLQPDPV